MAETIVFAGPCLPRKLDDPWRELLEGVELRPPAGRGDVLTALREKPRTLVVLDGVYYTVPAVTHKELLYALDAGVRVVGAASMGALRAAEMESFGMEGVGWVFERFRRGELVGDDEVAILHATEEHEYRPLTIALVEVRHALEESGCSTKGATRLVESLAALGFAERDPSRVEALAREALGGEGAAALMQRLAESSIKRDDAAAAIRRAGEHRPVKTGAGFAGEDRRRAQTEYLSHFREWDLRVSPQTGAPALREAWNVTQLLHPGVVDFVDAVRRRFVLASAAEQADTASTEAHGEAILDRLARFDSGLPVTEVREEARVQALAERGIERFGGIEEAGRFLAGELHLGAQAGWPELHELLSLQDDLIPPWAFVRAFAFTAAREPAVSVARAATQIHRAFRDWAEGARVERAHLEAVAADLWGCAVEDVEREAAARALFPSHGFTPGLRDAVEMVAAAERLGERPVNDYPHARSRLRREPLRLPLPVESPDTGTAVSSVPGSS